MPPVLDVVVPVHDEERVVEASRPAAAPAPGDPAAVHVPDHGRRQREHRRDVRPRRRVADELDRVRVVRLPEKGRGRALRQVWSDSDATVLAYMDVDLSTDLRALLPLVAPLVAGHSEIAIGTRLARGSRVVRGPRREVISRTYNLLLRGTLAARFSDAQCGFKAIRRDVAEQLLPLVEDTGWFFDTELLVLAERSRAADPRGAGRLGRRPGQPGRPRAPPPSPTCAASPGSAGRWPPGRCRCRPYGPSSAGRRSRRRRRCRRRSPGSWCGSRASGSRARWPSSGCSSCSRPALGAQPANLVALLLTAVANTAANRRLTFGVRGSEARVAAPGAGAGGVRHRARGDQRLARRGARLVAGPGRWVEVAALVVANAAATVVRFLMLRRWVFRPD